MGKKRTTRKASDLSEREKFFRENRKTGVIPDGKNIRDLAPFRLFSPQKKMLTKNLAENVGTKDGMHRGKLKETR